MEDYSAIWGITEQELRTQLKIDVQLMAQANKETYEEAAAHLKLQYNGYHFNSKGYAIPYQVATRKVIKVGVNFDSVTRTIGNWMIEY